MSNSQSRTVFLLGSFAPSLINFRGPLIGEMVARGHEVIAGAPDIDEPIAAQLSALGARPLNVAMQRTGTNPLSDLRLVRRLQSLFAQHRPDVLISYTAKPVIWGCIAAQRAGVGVIAPMITGLGYAFADGGTPSQRLLRRTVIAAYRKALHGAHTVFFQNPDDIEKFRELNLLAPRTNVVMINGSGVDVDHFAACEQPREPAFLMISRLLKAKGVREYGEAAVRVKRRFPQLHFALAGWQDRSPDAIDEADLARWSAGGLDYLGALGDVRPAIRDASIYVLPSYREGTPRSVLEAMAMGRAIITTNAPGCRETVVEGDNGLLVAPRDIDALERAMVSLIETPGLRAKMGRSSRARAETKYDVHNVNAAILSALGL